MLNISNKIIPQNNIIPKPLISNIFAKAITTDIINAGISIFVNLTVSSLNILEVIFPLLNNLAKYINCTINITAIETIDEINYLVKIKVEDNSYIDLVIKNVNKLRYVKDVIRV